MTPEDYAELIRLREEIKGPDGFATWKDAAVSERQRRVKLETQLDSLLSKQETLIEYLKGANDIIDKLRKVVSDDLR